MRAVYHDLDKRAGKNEGCGQNSLSFSLLQHKNSISCIFVIDEGGVSLVSEENVIR